MIDPTSHIPDRPHRIIHRQLWITRKCTQHLTVGLVAERETAVRAQPAILDVGCAITSLQSTCPEQRAYCVRGRETRTLEPWWEQSVIELSKIVSMIGMTYPVFLYATVFRLWEAALLPEVTAFAASQGDRACAIGPRVSAWCELPMRAWGWVGKDPRIPIL